MIDLVNHILNIKNVEKTFKLNVFSTFFREASGIRTPDNLIKSQVLYRLS